MRHEEPEVTSKQAIMPKSLVRLMVCDLRIGESRWVYPQVLHVDPDRRVWIDGNGFCFGQREDGATVEIFRDEGGFVASLEYVRDYFWARTFRTPRTEEAKAQYLPVLRLDLPGKTLT